MVFNPDNDDYDDPTLEMLDTLPHWYADGENTPNHDLYEPAGSMIRDAETDLLDIQEALVPQTADTIDQLADIAVLVNLTPEKGESVPHFRARILAEFQVVSSKGTIKDLINGLSTILNVDVGNISPYNEFTQGGHATVTVPRTSLENTNLTEDEVARLGEKLIAASYGLSIQTKGTLVFVTPDFYNNKTDWSTYEVGYDGLDGTGTNTPKGSGGTFAGIIGG